MAAWLYLIKVRRTLHQSPGLLGFDWPCLLPFNVKWQIEDVSFSFPLSFPGTWIVGKQGTKEEEGEDDGSCEVNGGRFKSFSWRVISLKIFLDNASQLPLFRISRSSLSFSCVLPDKVLYLNICVLYTALCKLLTLRNQLLRET